MNDYIRLPRAVLDMVGDKDLWLLYGYLLSHADENGVATFKTSELGMRFNLSRQQLRTILGKLVKKGVATNIQPTSNQQATNITLDFQRIALIEQPTSNQHPTNIQPTKASRKRTKFIPPSDEEVAAYVAEKGYHFNPAQFVPHYQKKGWIVGKTKMVDWHAACRTWEISWKEKYGERFYYEIQPITTTDNAATRKESRDRLRNLATGVLSQPSDELLALYARRGGRPDDSRD